MNRIVILLGAVLISAGIASAGWFVGEGFVKGREPPRIVTVKGLSEREVKADLALWPFRIVATHNELSEAHTKLAEDAAKVRKFLSDSGLDPADIEMQSLNVFDHLAQAYRGSGPVDSRYIVSQTLMLRTADVDKVIAASQRLPALVASGVVLNAENMQGPGPYYLFTRLNDIKPEMVAEATRNARLAAEQFAHDAQSRLGTIRRAHQGVFQILPRDESPGVFEEAQVHKKVRVVSTIEYELID